MSIPFDSPTIWRHQNTDPSLSDQCSSARIGYNPADVITRFEGSGYSTYREDTAEALTNVMILHPIAAGITFIAFILSIGTSFFGSFLSSMVSGSAFIVTLVALICDWVWMAIVANNVNDNGADAHDRGARARYDAALWCALAAAICAFISSVILFFTCCAGRRNRSRAERTKTDYHSPPATTTRRRWWSRNRY